MKKEYQAIIDEFKMLPKTNQKPTFMDICRMSGDRFEERCSQILKFYIDPSAPHNLYGLFLDSLLSLLDYDEASFNYQSVRVITEETTEERKRIDITIVGSDFVIAIENKNWASLYNDLSCYRKHIEEKYPNKKHFMVVLSVKPIVSKDELQKIQDNGYKYINYRVFFDELKKNIGKYAMNSDTTYVTFLYDFIRTIEKRNYYNNIEMEKFFAKNRETVKQLIKEFNKFEADIKARQCERIADIRNRVCVETSATWGAYEGWDLWISFNDQGNRIGIESSFKSEYPDNLIGDFHIYITVWKKECFAPYEAELKEKFPNCFIDQNVVENPNRIYLHLPVIKGDDMEEIVKKLNEYYDIMKEMTSRIH